ncbi:MAG: calcineurin-like phosphoesterase C-terminal domain-containing protein, partial [bacterium]
GGAVCGSWWIGTQDEYGIPHSMMADGAPNGYTIVTFKGNKYSFEYKSARKPLSFQMQVYAPDEITLDEVTSTVVQANIFAGSEKSKVEIKFGETGPWMLMEKAALPDQFYAKQYEIPVQKPGWIPRATDCPHMWKKALTGIARKGAYLIQVKETDMFGQTHTGARIIVIK